jgi:hypothetical protein
MDGGKQRIWPVIEEFHAIFPSKPPGNALIAHVGRLLSVVAPQVPRIMVRIRHTVSGHSLWPHWHAISTSLDPASLQISAQYFSSALARHLQSGCAHLTCSLVVVMVSSFLQSEVLLLISAAITLCMVKTARLCCTTAGAPIYRGR